MLIFNTSDAIGLLVRWMTWAIKMMVSWYIYEKKKKKKKDDKNS
jgi:hypothetical protein